MRKVAIFAGIILLGTQSGLAQSSYDFGSSLGLILASEEVCGMTFNQEAVNQYIEENVSAADVEFPQFLSAGINLGEYRIKEMNKTARAAHCSQIRRIALNYSFISEGDFIIGVPASP